MKDTIADMLETLLITILALGFLTVLIVTAFKARDVNTLIRQQKEEGTIASVDNKGEHLGKDITYTKEEVAAQIEGIDPAVTFTVTGVPAGTILPTDGYFTILSKIPNGNYTCEYTTDGSGNTTAVTYTFVY